MLAASLERISIGLLLIRKYNIFFVREASSPCNGNHFSSLLVNGFSVIVCALEWWDVRTLGAILNVFDFLDYTYFKFFYIFLVF